MLFAAVIFWIYSVEKAGGEISAGFYACRKRQA
jgi:hypothetical protein